MSSLKIVLAAVFFVALAAPGYAIDTSWSHDPATTGLWDDPLNWDNGVPTTGDSAYIDNGGTAQIDSGAAASALYVGDNSSGTVIQNAGITAVSALHLGRLAGSSGAYYLNGGQLTVAGPPPGLFTPPPEVIGYSGTGQFHQSGGTHTVSILYIGYNSGSSGTYDLQDGSLIAGSAYLGGANFQGTFNQTGGTSTVTGELYIRTSGNAYNLQNGSLTAAGTNIQESGTFNQTGGTNNAGYLWIISGGRYVLEDGTLNITNGALLINGTLDGNNGNGTLNINGGLADFTSATFANASSISFTTAANTLTIFAAGFDPLTAFGSYTPTGIVHTVGDTLTVNSGDGFAGRGTISDLVMCEGNIVALNGALQFNNDVTVTNGGSITTSNGTANFSRGITVSGGGKIDVDGQTINISGGTTLTLTATADCFKVGTLNYGASAIVQSGGTNSVGYLNAVSDASYLLEGGTLDIRDSARVLGTFDCNNGDATLHVSGGLADFTNATPTNIASTSFTSDANSLTIFATGFDPATAFGFYDPEGIVHIAGNTLVIHTGEGFAGRGTINDRLELEGTISAVPLNQTSPWTNHLALNNDILLYNGGSLNYATSTFTVAANKTATIESTGGTISAWREDLAAGSTFNQKGGTNFAGSIYSYEQSSYNLESGLLSAAYQSHRGTFTQTGGTNAAGNFYLYQSSVYHLIDGTLDVTWDGGREYMGYHPPFPPPVTTLTEFVQSGGINKTSFLDIIGASGYEMKYTLVAGEVFVENNITIGAQAYFADDNASSGGSIYTSGNFLNNSAEPELFSMVHTTLTMYGEAAGWPAILDTNSVNRGNSLHGLDDNFALGTLIFEGSTVSTTYYYRLDSDVYTYGLVLRQGALLDLNGHTLYYMPVGYSYNGIAPTTFCITGSWINGNIVPLVGICEPQTLALIAPALLGVAGAAYRKTRRK